MGTNILFFTIVLGIIFLAYHIILYFKTRVPMTITPQIYIDNLMIPFHWLLMLSAVSFGLMVDGLLWVIFLSFPAWAYPFMDFTLFLTTIKLFLLLSSNR